MLKSIFYKTVAGLALCILMVSCSDKVSKERTRVLIETDLGDITVELYNETPLHRDNFIKLAEQGDYDNLLFHRVIKAFMIQGGDPESKDAPLDKPLGKGQIGENIDAEIVYPQFFHKRGALAAARESDKVNPEKKSSGSQFYIVWGNVLTPDDIAYCNKEFKERVIQNEINRLLPETDYSLQKLSDANNFNAIQKMFDSLRTVAIKNVDQKRVLTSIPDSIQKVYMTQGGDPMLDMGYTVFGQVVEGLDVVEKIQEISVNARHRPYRDIKMKMKVIK